MIEHERMGKGFRYFHLNVGCWPDPDEILDDYESRLFSCPVCGAASIEPCYNSSGEVLDYHHPERYATLPDIYIEEGKEARTPFEIRSDIVRRNPRDQKSTWVEESQVGVDHVGNES